MRGIQLISVMISILFIIGCTNVVKLHKATMDGNLDEVQSIIETEGYLQNLPTLTASLTNKEISYDSYLPQLVIIAAREGHLNVLKYLVSQDVKTDAYVNQVGGRGARRSHMTPLLWAAYNGHLEIVNYLMSHGADLKAIDIDGNNAYQLALMKEHKRVAELLKSGVPVASVANLTEATPTSDNPPAAIASLVIEGDISATQQELILTALQEKLSKHYSLVAHKIYIQNQDAAFAEIAAQECAEESCMTEIQKSFNVPPLFTLKLKRTGGDTEITITFQRIESQSEEVDYCEKCNTRSINQRIANLIDTLVGTK